jgi:5-methylcytosine-specific restriction protein B
MTPEDFDESHLIRHIEDSLDRTFAHLQITTTPVLSPEERYELRSLIEMLRAKRQIILAGPPGTSKTFTALQIVAALAGVDGGTPLPDIHRWRFEPTRIPSDEKVIWEIVQFHPSYGYEDFVIGIDAIATHEGIIFERNPRILLNLSTKAGEHRGIEYVLIIDEINRGILGRIFGELIVTLEYRDLGVLLPGHSERITLPENMYIIGTMNTADRNIALLDHALRRRFLIVNCLPSLEILQRFLIRHSLEENDRAIVLKCFYALQGPFLSSQVDAYSRELTDSGLHDRYAADLRGYNMSDYAVGHTYFMVEDLETLWVNLRYQVLPLVEEYRKEGILTDGAINQTASALLAATVGVEARGEFPWIRHWCENKVGGGSPPSPEQVAGANVNASDS